MSKTAAAKDKVKASAGRARAARGDASVIKMQATIEQAFGLPEGSVKLVGPKKKDKVDESTTVANIREMWAS